MPLPWRTGALRSNGGDSFRAARSDRRAKACRQCGSTSTQRGKSRSEHVARCRSQRQRRSQCSRTYAG